MKVLFNCHVPFMLTHGGAQVQIEQTKAALEKIGVVVEAMRWWDEAQSGDILHHFARVPTSLVRMAQQKGFKVVMSAFLGGLGARPAWMRLAQNLVLRIVRPISPSYVRGLFDWDSYHLLDAMFAQTPYEASLLIRVHNAPPSRVHVVPNGVEDIFLTSQAAPRGEWLVCTANIIPLKRVLELAQMAVAAQTPVWVIGKPHSNADEYVQRFMNYAQRYPALVRYEGPITDRERLAQVYREARGFVLLSAWESLSLSALEAAACGCPLLLSDLPWAREAFKDKAVYCPVRESVASAAVRLRRFYKEAPNLEPPPRPLSWLDVGRRIKAVYETLLA